jgi:hypothetical protein
MTKWGMTKWVSKSHHSEEPPQALGHRTQQPVQVLRGMTKWVSKSLASVLAVDEHGDQGWIWLGDGENSLSFLP